MPFDDLSEFFDPTLPLPIAGKTYKVPSPSADVGLHCQLITEIARRQRAGEDVPDDELAMLTIPDGEEKEWHRRILGTALDEMLGDGVPWAMVQHASSTAFTWITAGKDAAERRWKSGGAQGEARPAVKAPQDRKPPAKKAATKKAPARRQ